MKYVEDITFEGFLEKSQLIKGITERSMARQELGMNHCLKTGNPMLQ